MREARNPFRLRTSEKIDSIDSFLRLFGPGVIDLLPKEQPWKRIVVLRSAPGGGKTSLMRVFTPQSLTVLHAHRYSDDYKDLNQRLVELDVFSDDGPQVLGVMLSCLSGDYASIGDLEMDTGRRNRLFLSLLNSRIVLSALRAICALKRCEYPQDLRRIQATLPNSVRDMAALKDLTTGMDLYQWAVGLESGVCDALDSLGPVKVDALPGHDSLFSLDIVRHETFHLDGRPVAAGSLLMLDDIQELTVDQRERLIKTIFGGRPAIGVWLAERYEALPVSELLSSGAIAGRDYDHIVELEGYWRSQTTARKFEKAVLGIADRRAQSGTESGVASFGGNLVDVLDAPDYEQRLLAALESVRTRVRDRVSMNPEFAGWIASLDAMQTNSAWDQAVGWRVIEIQIAREMGRAQKRFAFAISEDGPDQPSGSSVKAPAELFLSQEFSLPYYFGPGKLASMASSNIQQFVWLAGDLFEEMIAAALLRRPTNLSPDRQEAIVKKAIAERWQRIPQEIRGGREVKAFIGRVGHFAKSVTYRPNAPYPPGVTGIAISMRDRELLRDPQWRRDNRQFDALARVLTTAIAFNLLEAQPDYRVKGGEYLVLYLNRMICVQFDLPLGYGGFREQSLSRLVSWLGPSSPEAGLQEELL